IPAQRLDSLLVPERVSAEEPRPAPSQPLPLRLVRDDIPRPASGLECPLPVLAAWAELATTHQLTSLRAMRSGQRVFLVGNRLPLLSKSERFWGRRVLVPLGFRPEPALGQGALCEVLHLDSEELAVLRSESMEILPGSALEPLS